MNEATGAKSFVLLKNQQMMSLTLLPELNEVQWGEIESLGTEILTQMDEFKTPVVLVDLSGLNYMGSAMVALIVRVWKAVKGRSGKMSVVCPDPMVQQVLALAHLDKLWPITDTREEALKTLGTKEISTPAPSTNEPVATFGAIKPEPTSAIPMFISIIALIVGGCGVAFIFNKNPQVPDKAALGMAFGGAGLGFILGLVGMIKDRDYKKHIGLVTVIIGMILIIVTLLNKPAGP